MSEMPIRKRRNYTAEQRANAVRLYRELGSYAEVARRVDVTEPSLRNWVRQAEIDEEQDPEGELTTDEREELQRLRRRIRTLEMERDFAKKAAAFFAKDLDRPSS